LHQENGNLLIASLPPRDRDLLASHLEAVTLRLKDTLTEFDAPVEHVYFPESGMCSLLSVLANGKAVEVASAGREGMVGMPLFFRTERLPERCVVQLPGRALRMSAASFRRVLRESEALNDALHRYAGCMYTFASVNTACGRKHQVVPRLARWLLHAADQSGTQSLKLPTNTVP
jgi:CRP-like cAMP-binding protein